jgi:hypothetical protein
MRQIQKSGNRESGKAETLRSPTPEHSYPPQRTRSVLQLKTEFSPSLFPLSRFPAFRFSIFPLFSPYASL